MALIVLFLISIIIVFIGLSFLAAGGVGYISYLFGLILQDYTTDWGLIGKSFGIKKSERGKFIVWGIILILLGFGIFVYGGSKIK